MPMAFAVKMWNWTRMGARVIVTPGQIKPTSFTHPLLVAQKVVPQPLIADDPATDAPAVKSDKGADAGHATRPANVSAANSEPSLDLRSTVGHTTPLREQTHTADAGSALPAIKAVVTMSDATPSAAKVQPAGDPSEARADAPKSEAPANAADTSEFSKTDVPASESVKAEDRPGEAKVDVSSETKSDEVNPTAAIVDAEPARTEVPKAEEAKTSKAAEKTVEPVKAGPGAPAGPAAGPDATNATA